MRSVLTTAAAITALATTVSAYAIGSDEVYDSLASRDIENEDLFQSIDSREAEAEPILMMNHLAKWAGQIPGSFVQGFKQKSHPEGSSENTIQTRSLDDIYAREAEAEPILGINHLAKWAGQIPGSFVQGFKQKSNPDGPSENTIAARDLDSDELFDIILAREADAEPILGLNHLAKWAGQIPGSVVQGFRQKSRPEGSPEYTVQSRDLRNNELFDSILAREAEAEPIFGINHLAKWAGEIPGAFVQGYKNKANPDSSVSRRDIEDYEELLAREPVLGMNHLAKWAGEIPGSFAQGYKEKARPAEVYRRAIDDAEFFF